MKISLGIKDAHTIPYKKQIFEQIWGEDTEHRYFYFSVFDFLEFFRNEKFALAIVNLVCLK